MPARDSDPGVYANRDQLRSLHAACMPLAPLVRLVSLQTLLAQ